MAVVKYTGALDTGISGPLKAELSRNGQWFVSYKSSYAVVYQLKSDGTYSAPRYTDTGAGFGQANGLAITDDGTYLIELDYFTTNPGRLFEWNGTAYVLKTSLPDVSATGYQTFADFTTDQNRFIIGGWAFCFIYSFNPTTGASSFQKATNIGGFSIEDGKWSPDGSRVAFAAREGCRIYAVDGAGNISLEWSTSAFVGWGVSWSPDGLEVVFNRGLLGAGASVVRYSGGAWSVFKAEIDNTTQFGRASHVTIAGVNYLLLQKYQGPGDYRAYDRNTAMTSYVTQASIGLASPADGGGINTAHAKASNGDQYYVSMLQTTAVMNAWRITTPPPTITITGAIDLPAVSVSGSLQQVMSASAAIQLPLASVAGSLNVRDGIYGLIPLPGLNLAGLISFATDDPVVAPATILLPAYATVTPPVIDPDQVAQAPEYVDGILQLPRLTTDGLLNFHYYLSGDIGLPRVYTTGVLSEYHLEIDGELQLPRLTVDGSLAGDLGIYGDIFLPEFSTDGLLNMKLAWNAALDLPSITVGGTLALTNLVTADIALPRVATDGLLMVDELWQLWGNVDLPTLETNGYLLTPILLTGEIKLPGLSVSGILGSANHIDANLRLPRLTVEGELDMKPRKRRNIFIVQPL